MFKKIGVVTALSATLLFGGAFSSNAEASADQNQSFNTLYKAYYSVNGDADVVSENDIQGLLDNVLNRFDINWNDIDWQSLKIEEEKENNEEAAEKQSEPEKVTEKEEPAKEEPVQEQPAAEKPVEEEPVKQEQPKQEQPKQEQPKQEQPEAPAQQPTQQPAQPQEQPSQNQEQSQQLSQFEQEVVELTNQERAKQGLAALQIDTELSKVAREKSRDMAVNNYFDHNSPTHGSPFDMMKSYGISYKTAGENIAKGQRTPAEVVNAWMNSEGHRANILNGNYTHIGVGYVEQGNHWTQQFIGK
ncbi:CAP domain-containing protein [Oceanobacillus damuensis]|uniref:CAP domain-containing protein n=1 Tax=Oceanobacillus damuensis TaxID=937928 RepID=UPI000833812C|nr:CAP domain-containing protein [Oceanobacillus damuensis]